MASLNRDPNLLLAAAANPILALDEMGYKIKPDIRPKIEDNLRFKPSEITKISRLRKSIYKEAGKEFNIRAEEELNIVLFKELNIRLYDEKGCPIHKRIRILKKGEEDDLHLYSDLHPIIKPLLAFREIDASVHGFSDPSTYKRIRKGGYGEHSNITLKVRLKRRKKNI